VRAIERLGFGITEIIFGGAKGGKMIWIVWGAVAGIILLFGGKS
jgi:hypothetical protein